MRNHSWEQQTAAWLLRDGWEVFWPMTDVGQKTDFLISDGKVYHRIQVKALESNTYSKVIKNTWGRTKPKCDYVIIVLKGCGRGLCFPSSLATGAGVNLETASFQRFSQDFHSFIEAFRRI